METLHHSPACHDASQGSIWGRRALSWLAWINNVFLVFTLSRYRCAPARRVTRGRGAGAHRCTTPCCESSRLRLARLLDGSWSNRLPRGVVGWELVGSSGLQSCLTEVGRIVRLAKLLSGTWSDRPLHRVARRELVEPSVSPSCLARVGRCIFCPVGPPQAMDLLRVTAPGDVSPRVLAALFPLLVSPSPSISPLAPPSTPYTHSVTS